MLLLAALACQSAEQNASNDDDSHEDSADTGDSGSLNDTAPEDSGAPDGSTWTLGETEPCAAPVKPGWTDASAAFDDGLGRTEPGSAIYFDDGDGSSIAVPSESGDQLRVWSLPDGTPSTLDLAGSGDFLEMWDLDGDGIRELITGQSAIVVVWDFEAGGRTPVEIHQDGMLTGSTYADLNGDGLVDIWYVKRDDGADFTLDGGVLLNNGDRTFTYQAPPSGELGAVFDFLVHDMDRDGDNDVFICNDKDDRSIPNQVVRNDGDGALALVDAGSAAPTMACMGVAHGDVNADGALDLVLTTDGDTRLLADYGEYVEVGAAMGMPTMSTEQMGWGAAVVDFDNDGYDDIAVASADFTNMGERHLFPIQVFTSDGAHLSESGKGWGFPQSTLARSLIVVDTNGDHLVDVFSSDGGGPPWGMQSNGCTAAHWFDVEAPSGAYVEIDAGDRTRVAHVDANQGYFASGLRAAHFGLGSEQTVDRVTVTLPSGAAGTLWGPLAADRTVRFVAPAP